MWHYLKPMARVVLGPWCTGAHGTFNPARVGSIPTGLFM